jgi:hypothetical protein
MKTLLGAIIGAIAIGATLPAIAGPDWQIIEHGRKVKAARMQQAAAAAAAPAPAPVGLAAQPAQTMAANSDYEKMMKECAEMMKDAQQRENVK